jgi:hypothetical protein
MIIVQAVTVGIGWERTATARATYQAPSGVRAEALPGKGRRYAEHALLRFPGDVIERSPFRKQR